MQGAGEGADDGLGGSTAADLERASDAGQTVPREQVLQPARSSLWCSASVVGIHSVQPRAITGWFTYRSKPCDLSMPWISVLSQDAGAEESEGGPAVYGSLERFTPFTLYT